MITQHILNTEFDLAKRVYVYYWDKMADFISIGSDRYQQWYKDLCILYYLTQAMESISLTNNKLYLGSREIDDNLYMKICYNVREYVTADMKEIVYAGLDASGNINDYTNPSAPVTIVTYNSFSQDWKSVVVTVETDDVTTVALPFNINNTDAESIRLVVGDGDPIFITAPDQEGFHIVGSTLYWHTYYNLKAGDRIYIQYVEKINI